MNIEYFKRRIELLLEDIPLPVYYASAGDRNSDLNIEADEFLMITPIQSLPLGMPDSCYVDVEPQMRIYRRRELGSEGHRDLHTQIELMKRASEVYDKIQASSDILIREGKRTITATYSRSDSGSSSLSESVIRFSLPLRLNGKEYFYYE